MTPLEVIGSVVSAVKFVGGGDCELKLDDASETVLSNPFPFPFPFPSMPPSPSPSPASNSTAWPDNCAACARDVSYGSTNAAAANVPERVRISDGMDERYS